LNWFEPNLQKEIETIQKSENRKEKRNKENRKGPKGTYSAQFQNLTKA
jgi:hypothetical protein